MKSLNGLGILGNGKGKVRSWWMPRWCCYVRMVRPMKAGVFTVVNRKTELVNDLPVMVKNDEVTGTYLEALARIAL